ncbi:MAG: EAL domain-containing protein [Cyanobacteria bacterium P01_H01_bin.15]
MSGSAKDLQQVFHVLVIEDRKAKRIVTLEAESYNIGRDSQNAIVIYDPQVSRHHATIFHTNNSQADDISFTIVDGDRQGKKSTNGITVNGHPVTRATLQQGDLIRFGSMAKARYHALSDLSEVDLLKAEDLEDDSTRFDLGVNSNSVLKTTTAHHSGTYSHPDLGHLASFPELSPHPIVEVSWQGEVTYQNPAAQTKFRNLAREKSRHPLLAGLLKHPQSKQNTLFVREIPIGQETFEQYVHYLPDKQLVRSYIFDFTKRKQAEAFYRSVVEQIPQGFLLASTETKRVIEANKTFGELLGYTNAELLELSLFDVLALVPDQLEQQLAPLLSSEHDFSGELIHRSKNGSFINLPVAVSRIVHGEQTFFCFIVCPPQPASDDILVQDAKTAEIAPIDFLDEERCFERLEISIADAKENNYLVALLLIDLERFQAIKDTFGEQISERLFRQLAYRLQLCIRQDDCLARFSGARLGILLPSLTSVNDIAAVCQRIVSTLKQPFDVEDGQLELKNHIGVAVFPQDGDRPQVLLQKAEMVILEQSQTQEEGNSLDSNTPGISASSLQLKRAAALQQALDEEQLELLFQPQIKASNGQIIGFQTHIRAHHPELENLSVSQLVSAAAEINLIYRFNRWLVYSACQQGKRWQDQALPPIRVIIRLTAEQFQQPTLVAMVSQVLAQTSLDPQWLEIELSETAAMQDVNLSRQILWQLREKGVFLGIANFGSGHSSYAQLKRLPFDTLKIDPSFVQDIGNSTQDMAIVTAIVALSRGFNLRVVGEGITESRQVELLRRLQCEHMQGELISAPLTISTATEYLTTRKVIHI